MVEHDRLRAGQFRVRQMFIVVTASALVFAAFRWLPFIWVSNGLAFGMFAVALVVRQRSPILHCALLTLGFTVAMSSLAITKAVQDGWEIGSVVVLTSVAVFAASGAVEVWKKVAARGRG